MRLGIKLALSTICVVSILFGICGATITYTNFQNTLDREKASVKESYVSLVETIGVLQGAGIINDGSDVANVLSRYDSGKWEAIRASLDGKVLYESESIPVLSNIEAANLFDEDPAQGSIEDSASEEYSSSSDGQGSSDVPFLSRMGLQDLDGRTLLWIGGKSNLGGSMAELTLVKDIGQLYDAKDDELHMFSFIFALMVLVSAVAAFASAYVITRPLSKLSKATKEISANNLASRSRITTDDEIGDLSRDFDNMASRLESNVNEMQSMLDSQSMFMGSFAHEMKTPMTSVIGYADLIRQGVLDEVDKEKVANYIFNEGKRLESLSSKLLEMFLMDEKSIEAKRIEASSLIESVVEPLKIPFSKMGIDICCSADPCMLEIDEGLSRSLLVNLIENAKRALSEVEDAKVLVKGVVRQDGYEISVTDNGCGIPKSELDKITKEFYRVDKARSRRSGGVGLGLSLCERIVAAHDGEMSIASSLGNGTCVKVRFNISPRNPNTRFEGDSI